MIFVSGMVAAQPCTVVKIALLQLQVIKIVITGRI